MGAATTTPETAVVLTAQQYAAIMDKIDRVDALEARIKILEGHKKPAQLDRILTVEETAKRLGKSTKTIYRRIAEKKLKTVSVDGKAYGIRESEVLKYLER
ncbi:helix-turn-helix transcriptional regulator [Runella sp.]|uniref:helix-turn-helix transcriptional regulator n=1 Tax=Runella sp. TaxID=1960881 RepID=UPI003D0991CA